jgi:hypothetical protein
MTYGASRSRATARRSAAVLLTSFYEDPDPGRHGEFLESLRRNLANELLVAVHVFLEDLLDPDRLRTTYSQFGDAKVCLVSHGRRATYEALFAYANRRLAGRRVIIANADIYFDRTLALLDGWELQDELLCLSRWDVRPDGSAALFEHTESQDAWIFDAPIREFTCDFHLGVLACDNRLAWEAANAGLTLSNPARSVRAYHLHLSRVRRYSASERVAGPTQAVPAS